MLVFSSLRTTQLMTFSFTLSVLLSKDDHYPEKDWLSFNEVGRKTLSDSEPDPDQR